jgi:membrane fusion protein, copper/silver efflux system
VNRRSNVVLICSLIVGIVALGIASFRHGSGNTARVGTAAAEHPGAAPDSAKGGRTPLYWYDPMVPEKHFDKPGKSPFMDMQLAAKYPDDDAGSVNGAAGSIAIDPRVVQNLGVRLGVVERGHFARAIDTVGCSRHR